MGMPDISYGSDAFRRVADNERVLVGIEGTGPRAALRRAHRGSVERALYRLRLPSLAIELTSSPSGRMIGEHLAIREGRRFRHRDAQGVLEIPVEHSDYLRGRHRQAVRTNTNHARKAGLTVSSYTLDEWGPGPGDFRAGHITPGPIERWMVLDADGEMVADSILSVDERVALLHGMVSSASNARWLLHTEIVRRLCGTCQTLLANGAAVYRESYGSHHFQQLLGYQIMRLKVRNASGFSAVSAAPAGGSDRLRARRAPQELARERPVGSP